MGDDDIPVSAMENSALPSLDGAIDEDMSIGEAQDRQHSPRERPLAVNDWGTTAEEERRGEPLDGRLAREEPETAVGDGPYLEDPYPNPAGRLVEPDAGLGPDEEKDVVAADVGRDRGGRSAEEAAMRITEEPPGASWSDGDYVEGE